MKLTAIVLGICAVLGAVSGCGYFSDKKSPQGTLVVAAAGKESCFKTLGSDLRSWMKTGEPAVGPMIDCGLFAMDKFVEDTRGSDQDSWSRGELVKFVSTYFAQPNSNVPVWMEKVFKIKHVALGGKADRVSRSEIARLKSFLIQMRPKLESASAFVPIAFFQVADADDEKIEATSRVIESIMSDIKSEIAKTSDSNRPSLGIDQFFQLFRDLEWDHGILKSWVPVMIGLKSAAIGGDKNEVAPTEWNEVMSVGARGWSVALRIRYQILPSSDLMGSALDALERTSALVLQMLESAVAKQGAKGIPLERIEDMVDGFAERQLLPHGIRAASIKSILPNILSKALYGASKQDWSNKRQGLSLEQIKVLREIAADWFGGQREILAVVGKADSVERSELLRGFGVQKNLVGELEDPLRLSTPFSRHKAAQQIAQILRRGRPLTRDPHGRIQLAPLSGKLEVSRPDLDLLNSLRTGVSALLRGYVRDPKAARELKGFDETEVQDLYVDLREIGKDLNLVDPRLGNSGRRTFMEASIFTSVSNGDERIQLQETIEWFYLAMGAGTQSRNVHAKIAEACGNQSLDVFGRQKLDTPCFRKSFQNVLTSFVPNLPGFVRWYEADVKPAAGEKSRKDEFQVVLEEAGRGGGYSDYPVDSSDILSFMPIIHYAENLIVTYDKNGNDQLDKDEIWAAFPVIQPFIRRLAAGQAETEALQKTVFSYILRYGEPPGDDKAKFMYWFAARRFYNETADRMAILKVISSFTRIAREDRIKRIQAYYGERRQSMALDLSTGDPSTMMRLADLFACLPEAIPALTQVLQNRYGQLDFTKPEADRFIKGVRGLVDQDARLQRVCAPF